MVKNILNSSEISKYAYALMNIELSTHVDIANLILKSVIERIRTEIKDSSIDTDKKQHLFSKVKDWDQITLSMYTLNL